MTEAALLNRLEQMTSAMQLMASMLGTRLDRGQLAERMGIHRNTLRQRLNTDNSFPRPGKDGKWMLCNASRGELRTRGARNWNAAPP